MLVFALKMMTNTFNFLTADEQMEATNGAVKAQAKGQWALPQNFATMYQNCYVATTNQ